MNTLNKALTKPSWAAVSAEENFSNSWPFEANYSEAPGFRMHYIDEGEGAETLLLLHGEPTWSYLFRKQIAHWSTNNRVLAVDHMGFGKSETPPDRTYWLQNHVDNLERLILSLDLHDITLVMHDFGGPVGMGLSFRHPDRVKRFVSINGPTPAGQEDLISRITNNVGKSPWFQWIMKAESEGILEQVLGNLDYNILSTLKLNGFERNEIIRPEWLEAYRAPFPNREETLGAIGWAKGFATSAHDFAIPDEVTKYKLCDKPAMAIWGLEDKTLHAEEFIPLFLDFFQEGRVIQLPGVGHYSPEDAPDIVSQLVSDFLQEKR